jgi:hypothetical protein
MRKSCKEVSPGRLVQCLSNFLKRDIESENGFVLRPQETEIKICVK